MDANSARVSDQHTYEPPFEPRLQYDAKAMNANTARIATMGRYALIPGVRFCRYPQLGNRDLRAETIAACKPLGILVVPYVSTGYKLAWIMVTRDHPEYGQKTTPGGPPAVPRGERPRAAAARLAARGSALQQNQPGSTLEVVIPRLEAYQAVQIEVE